VKRLPARDIAAVALAALCGLALPACAPGEPEPEPADPVQLYLWTSLCEPDPEDPPPDWFAVEKANPYPDFRIAWELLCVRDGAEVDWFALKVSHWDDRSEDLWNVWYLDPNLREVRFGDAELPGDVQADNTSYPAALERVPPRAMPPGDYRVEVWALLPETLDSQRSEVRLTVTED
jgi:hypothetical protein